MDLGPFSGYNPIENIDVTFELLDTRMSDELEERLKQPGISSGLTLKEKKSYEIKVSCRHWVNVNQLERIFKACAIAIFNKESKNFEKK